MRVLNVFSSVTAVGFLFFTASTNADMIAVIDGGGPTPGDSAHSAISDLSTGGDSIGSMTGSFSSGTPAGWQTGDADYWANTEWDFAPGAGLTATWTFGNLAVGSEWDVFATWKEQVNRSTAAPYSLQGGTDILVNQEAAPLANLVLDDGVADAKSSYNFQKLGTATANGAGELVVTLGSAADDWVILDAVAISIVPEPGTFLLCSLGLLGLAAWKRRS